MWRSFFLAIGLSTFIFGAECLGVEKMVSTLQRTPPRSASTTLFGSSAAPSPVPREFVPKPFVPWTLMSTGAVICLYSFTLRKK